MRRLLVLAFAAEHLIMATCTALIARGMTLTALCEPVKIPPIGISFGYACLPRTATSHC
jgi:hypothetical protein